MRVSTYIRWFLVIRNASAVLQYTISRSYIVEEVMYGVEVIN